MLENASRAQCRRTSVARVHHTSMDDRLLIIDDEPAVGALIARIADRVGYQTLVVDRAEGFMQHVHTWRPTHIVMDLHMPVVGGLELLSQLAGDHCTATIVLISGVDDSEVNAARQVGMAHGLNMAAALTKPFSSLALTDVLRANRLENPDSP